MAGPVQMQVDPSPPAPSAFATLSSLRTSGNKPQYFSIRVHHLSLPQPPPEGGTIVLDVCLSLCTPLKHPNRKRSPTNFDKLKVISSLIQRAIKFTATSSAGGTTLVPVEKIELRLNLPPPSRRKNSEDVEKEELLVEVNLWDSVNVQQCILEHNGLAVAKDGTITHREKARAGEVGISWSLEGAPPPRAVEPSQSPQIVTETLERIMSAVKAEWRAAQLRQQLVAVRREASHRKQSQQRIPRPVPRPPSGELRPHPPFNEHDPAPSIPVRSLPRFTHLSFASSGVRTEGPVIHSVPALLDGVWSSKKGESELQDFLRQVEMPPESEDKVVRKAGEALEREGVVGWRREEILKRVRLHGAIEPHKTLIETTAFEHSDPGRIRRDHAALKRLLESLPPDRAQLIKGALTQESDPILRTSGSTTPLEPREVELLLKFERMTRVSAWTAWQLAHRGAVIDSPAQVERDVTCEFCGAAFCDVHARTSAVHSPTTTACAVPPFQRARMAKAAAIKSRKPVPLNTSDGYKPCGCGPQGLCSKRECWCVSSGTWCDRFCGCAQNCARRWRGCKCAIEDKLCQEKCPCFKENRECDPQLCAAHVDNPSHDGDGFCGANPATVGRTKRAVLGLSHQVNAGFGVFACEAISPGDLIEIYSGEAYDPSSAFGQIFTLSVSKRCVSYDFQVDETNCVWPERVGNHARFINTLKRPGSGGFNVAARAVYTNGVHNMALFANGDIAVGEELYVSYGPDYPMDWPDEEEELAPDEHLELSEEEDEEFEPSATSESIDLSSSTNGSPGKGKKEAILRVRLARKTRG